MTAKFGLNLGRLAKAFAAVMALSVGSTALAAQETAGKIEGTVRDPNGQPVAGAQVFIVGSSFATQTNNSGYYFLNNVPSGTYTVRAQFIGMQPAEVQNVRVRGGQTLTVGFDLQGAVALEAISVTVAETPIVPRDQVSSRSIVSGGDVDDLPVNDPTSIVTLQPGVVVGRGGAISIRGGRRNEAAVFIDGAPVRSGTTGSTNLNIATNSLEEVAVTTGALGAEFGDAQSGVISFVTRAGGPNFAGSLTYETDEFFGSQARGRNRFEGSLSGPLFGTLTFFVGGTVTGATSADLRPGADEVPIYRFGGVDTTVTVARSGADSARVAVPMFVQVGGECDDGFQAGSANRTLRNQDAAGNTIECQGVRRPGSWNTQARVSGKLQLTYGSGSRMSVSAHLDRDQSLGSGFNLESSAGSRSESGIYVLNWVQQVFRGVSSELAFDINLSYQTDQVITGLVEREWDLDHRDPSLSIVIDPVPFVFDFDHFSDDTGPNAVTSLNTKADWERLILNVRTNLGTRVPLLDRNDLRPNPQPRRNPYACINCGFSIEGLPGTFMRIREESRLIGRGNIDWQAGRFNRFKFGGEIRSIDLREWSSNVLRQFGSNIFMAEPEYQSAYAQDRLDLGDVVIEFGIRWDRYDSGALFPQVPGRLFTHPAFDVNDPTISVDAPAGAATSTIYKVGESHTAWSPRLRVAFPITDQTGFRMSYSHQAQTPDFFNLYEGANNDLSQSNTNDRFGGDVDFAKTIMFEFGIRHAFSQDMVIDISAYNRDKVSDITYRILPFFDPFFDRINNVNILTNADFGNVRGIDFQIQRRFSNIFSGQVNYTFQNSKSTGSDPTDFLFGLSRQPAGVTGERPEAPQTTLRTRDDRRHNISGSWSLTFPSDYNVGLLSNVGVHGTFRFRSGLPYTRLLNTGNGSRSTGGFGLISNTVEALQSSETPWTKFLDVRVTKALGGLTLYADIRNLLDWENRTSVFSETGDITNDEFFREAFLDPQEQFLRSEATVSGVNTSVDTADGPVFAADLRGGCSGWLGAGGAVACHMLRQAEARFGNGDGIYDLDEHENAVRAWFIQGSGPHTFLGNGREIRVGAQLDF